MDKIGIKEFVGMTIQHIEARRHNGEEDGLTAIADAFYASFDSNVPVPSAVKRGIVLKFAMDTDRAKWTLMHLKPSYVGDHVDYWSFFYAGMMHGIEPDGYIHT